ncbi:MAG: hypothetical protein DLM50_00495 [Candidatus Meridianibacter frigidus]|nr:MAG: hypothetical protein DLM50_00495 [Candidatus Eremiobacteraeota bacterium]
MAAACAVAVLLSIVQFASSAIFARVAARGALPSHYGITQGERIYRSIERVAPFPFVEDMLARAALNRHDPAEAQAHIERMPPTVVRNELRAQLEDMRGNRPAALRHYLAAVDVDSVQFEIDRFADAGQIARAYALESALRERLSQAGTHLDALAETYWHLGVLAARQSSAQEQPWKRTALTHYQQALALAPFSEKYLLAAGTQALDLGDFSEARLYYERGTEVDPASADAYAGLALVAYRAGDRNAAVRLAHISAHYDPHSRMLARLYATWR